MVDVTIDLTQDFLNGTIKARLGKMESTIDKVALESVDEAATFVVQMAKNLVRVDTGTLRKTIRKERGGTGYTEMRVRAGGYFINPKTGRICDYAGHVENKYPYLRPAINMARGYLRSLLKEGILREV